MTCTNTVRCSNTACGRVLGAQHELIDDQPYCAGCVDHALCSAVNVPGGVPLKISVTLQEGERP